MGVRAKLTIITINYNNLSGLKSTLKSVFEQSFQQFEYILIDGGSSDGSRELIEANADRFTFRVSEPDDGIYHAMNKGLKRATGEYVIHMNSGDTFFSLTTLEEVIPHLHSGEDVICGHSQFVNDVEWGGDSVWLAPKVISFGFFCRDTLNHQSVFIKRALFEQVGFYEENYKAASDWAFFLKAFAFHQAKYKHLDIMISKYDRSGFSTVNGRIGAKEQQDTLRKEFTFFYDFGSGEDIRFISPFFKNLKRNLKRLMKIVLPHGIVRLREIHYAKKIRQNE